ncbi:MAG: MFS transporter [Anaerolineae bacterium]
MGDSKRPGLGDLAKRLPIDPATVGGLRRPQFLYLMAQQFLSLAATYAISFASIAKVVGTSGSGVQTAFTILSVVVPGLIFGLLGGVTVDRVRRRSMLIATNVVRGLIALPALLYWDWLPADAVFYVILGVNFLLSSVGQFNFPAESALIPYIVTSEELTGANSAFNVSYLAAIAFGGGMLGPLSVKLLGPGWTYFLGGLLFLLTLIPLGFLAKDPPPRERVLRRSRYARLRHVAAVFADIQEGVSFALHNGAVSVAILALISQTALALGLAAVFPVVMQERFGVAVYNLPLVLLPAGAGAGLGLLALLSPQGTRRKRNWFVLVGNGLIGLGLLGFTLTVALPGASIWGIIGSSPLVGAGFVMSYISAKSVLQEEPPHFLRGRVISLQLTLNNVVSLLPTVMAGWALDSLGASVPFIAATVGFGLVTTFGLRLVRHHDRPRP